MELCVVGLAGSLSALSSWPEACGPKEVSAVSQNSSLLFL